VEEKDTGRALTVLSTGSYRRPAPQPGSTSQGGRGSATAAASSVIPHLFGYVAQRRVRVASRVVEDAAAEVHMTVDELVARLAESDLHGELAAKVLIAAQDSGCEERLRP